MPEAIVVDQDDLPGTGRAVEIGIGALPDDFDGDVVVVSGDVPLLDAATLAGLLAAHREAAAAATLLSAIVDDATGYGRIVRDNDGSLSRIVEQKDAVDDELSITEINSGTYVFAVAGLRAHLPRVGTGNAQGEKYLTDVVALLREAGQSVAAVPVPDPWIVEGVNDRVQLARHGGSPQRDDRARLAAGRRDGAGSGDDLDRPARHPRRGRRAAARHPHLGRDDRRARRAHRPADDPPRLRGRRERDRSAAATRRSR